MFNSFNVGLAETLSTLNYRVSGYQKHSNNRSSISLMKYGSDLGSWLHMLYIHELREKLPVNFRDISLLIVCFQIDNRAWCSRMMFPNDDLCLNPVSSWRCELWSPHSSSYSLQVLRQSYYFQIRVIS
jgi:hypothetical protein